MADGVEEAVVVDDGRDLFDHEGEEPEGAEGEEEVVDDESRSEL